MSLTIATWNINSVRPRIANAERYLQLRQAAGLLSATDIDAVNGLLLSAR